MLGTGFFLKIAKINSQQEKPVCPNCIKISSRKTQKITTRQKKKTAVKISYHTVTCNQAILEKKNRLIVG